MPPPLCDSAFMERGGRRRREMWPVGEGEGRKGRDLLCSAKDIFIYASCLMLMASSQETHLYVLSWGEGGGGGRKREEGGRRTSVCALPVEEREELMLGGQSLDNGSSSPCCVWRWLPLSMSHSLCVYYIYVCSVYSYVIPPPLFPLEWGGREGRCHGMQLLPSHTSADWEGPSSGGLHLLYTMQHWIGGLPYQCQWQF